MKLHSDLQLFGKDRCLICALYKITRKRFMKLSHIVIIFLFLVAGCEDQSPEFRDVKLTEGCTTNLAIVNTFWNVSGTITRTESTISPFTISGGPERGWTATGPLLPCNLPPELETDSLEIIFSGHMFEDFPGANAVGILFEFTKIRVGK